MASRKLTDTHPVLREQFIKAKKEFEERYPSVTVFLTATYRSPEEQNELYAQGRTKKGRKVTNAKAYQSPHNFNPSMAIDVAFIVDNKVDWSEKWFKEFSKSMKNDLIEWGGDFQSIKDMPHYQISNWKELAGK